MYKQRLKEYIEEDQIYQDYKEQKEFESSDFDNFCILHCEDIEEALFDLEQLSKINKELHNKIDKAIDVIHTQMKNNPSYKENLKIIENNLIKGSCKVCDLKDSDVDA